MADSTPSSPVLFNAQLWSGNNAHTLPLDAKPAAKSSTPPASPLSRRSVSFQVDHSPFISVDPSAAIYDAFPGTSAISPASTASPLPDPAYSPLSAPLHTLSEADSSTPTTAAAQVFDAFSWSAAITPHDYASAPQPYTPGHPANVAHREAMERELSYEGADPEVVEGNSGPSRRSSSSSRRRGSGSDSAATSQNAAGTSTAHARAVTSAVKPKSHARKMSAGHVLRPRNAFIIFRSAMIKEGAITENMEKDHGNISTICGILWRKLSATEKLKYQRLADLEKEQHRIANPGYKYAPKTRKEPPARRRQKKDQDVVARRCALAASLLAEGRRGSEMARQLEHFDTEVATQIKQEKEEAARLGIRTDPYAHAHSAKKLKRMEKERKERERALAAQPGAANLREGVLAMHAQADAQAAEKARAAAAGPFSRAPRNGYAVPPAPVAPAPTAPSAPAWINPWASSSVPEGANMGRRPSSCPPPAAGNISIPALPTVPSVPIYNDYVSPTQPHAPHLVIDNMGQQSHPGPATAPLHHPQPNSGFAVPRRRSSSVPPPSLYAAPAQQSYPSRWEPGTRRPSVVFSMELERRPSQVQWNDDMGMGDARRPSLAGQALGFGLGGGWSRRPSAMMWAPQERRMSAQAPNGNWYSNGMTSSHLDEPAEPQINFGNFSFQTTTNNANTSYAPNAGGLAAPGVGPDQAYQFPPAAPNDVEMYNDLGPSPFGAILAQQNQGMPAVSHGGWHGHQNEARSTMSPAPAGYSHAPHTPEADFYQPTPPGNHYAVPSVQVHEPTWSAPLNGDHSVPHTPSGSSPHTGIDEEEGDMFQPFGEEVAFPELNHGSREGSGAPEPRVNAFPPQPTKSLPYPHSTVPLSDIIHDTAIGPEDDMNAYTQGADNIGLGYDNWKMLGQVNERFD